ncbi:UNVERIFIED_ORG: UDP-glucose 4-epimerase [Clostridium botulinum]|uniref:NAD-dependent epimerase/dehydratase family protein n=1 Tax=Clostridium botulinum TaxID=1491 RepID=UPI00077468CF|nr:NAD(P)-dependent oxidoreductase [Clostridium botulinum]
MKILLTGASGYIGKHLYQSAINCGNMELITANRESFDYSDVKSIEKFFMDNKGITHIIHLASSISNNSEDLFDVNLLGLYKFLNIASKNNIKHFIFASTNNVYNFSYGKPICENEPCEPSFDNKYGFSKYMGELLIKDLCQNRGILFSNVRIADVYGSNQKHGNLIKAIVENVRENRPLKIYGDGKRIRDYIYIQDVVDGLLYIANNKLTGDYNLSTGIGTSVREILDTVNNIFNNTLETEKINVDNEDESIVILDCKKINNEGFVAKYSVKDGFTKILKENE